MRNPFRKQSPSDPERPSGVVRVDARTKTLTKRLQPGDIAVIDHADLDRVAAETLVERRPAAVLNAARSVSGRYPNLGPGILLDAGVLQDTYVLRYTWGAGGDEVSWVLVSSDLQKDQRGRYVLTQQVPGSTKVTYELMVDLQVPMIGQLKRRAEKAITDAALNDLKKRVEG